MADKLKLDRHDMKNKATSHLRIYVGGIPDNTTVEDLYDHFICYGQINGIVINRLFGFVQFETEKSAQEAISKADGSLFHGKTVSVRTTQSNQDKRRDPDGLTMLPEISPGLTQTENQSTVNDDEEAYDNFGNYIGDQNYRDEDFDENSSFGQGWKGRDSARGSLRGRARLRARARPRSRGNLGFRDRSPITGRGYDRYDRQISDFQRLPVTERNDCEIIVVSKTLTEYAEYVESRLKHLGIVVDLLFPMEDVPIGKVLGNIASRGCLYAILVMPVNQERKSLTLTILHGLPQEHRNIPIEDALQLISRNFQEVQRGGPSGREAVYALLGQLADGRTLTVMQYEKVIEYLQERKEQQVKIELGEPLPSAPVSNKAQVDLQQRILSILNDKTMPSSEPAPPAAPVAAPVPAPATAVQNKLLNDPTVRKALDSILQKFI